MKKKIVIGIFIIAAILTGWHFAMTSHSYTYSQVSLPETFKEFYVQKLKKSKELNARINNEERLVQYADKTPIAILYIHGYGASRAEGELVVDRISYSLKANTYYLRLPGHGTNVEDQARVSGKDHLDEAITTLKMMHKLGDKVIVVGTSMGGMIATYIAAKNPELIDAMILISPAYQYAGFMPKLAGFYPMFKLVTTIIERKPAPWPIPKEKDNWSLYWYANQYLRSMRQIYQLQSLTSHESVYKKVTQPVMLMYYYKDEKNQDKAASVAGMREAYMMFNNGTPNPKSVNMPYAVGGHVMTSKYTDMPPDYDKVTKDVLGFIKSLGWNK